MYYFMVFDCDVNFSLAFVHPEIRDMVPALHARWSIQTREGIEPEEEGVEYVWSELSLEDEGEHELHYYMQIVMGIFTLIMLKAYHNYYTTHDKIMSPHLFMILSFLMFLVSTIFEHFHWHDYHISGEGHH